MSTRISVRINYYSFVFCVDNLFLSSSPSNENHRNDWHKTEKNIDQHIETNWWSVKKKERFVNEDIDAGAGANRRRRRCQRSNHFHSISSLLCDSNFIIRILLGSMLLVVPIFFSEDHWKSIYSSDWSLGNDDDMQGHSKNIVVFDLHVSTHEKEKWKFFFYTQTFFIIIYLFVYSNWYSTWFVQPFKSHQ